MICDVLKTKFGNARLDKGYYVIKTCKEGNHGKFLHKLIFEDFYNFKVPEGYVVHHKNGNKLDNCILNLQLMSNTDHSRYHTTSEKNPFYNKSHKIKSKVKMSKSKNSTGFFRVYKNYDSKYTQGFIYVYRYLDKFGKTCVLKSVDLKKLKEKVINKNLLWKEL